MTLPQFSNYTPGQIIDRSRTIPRSRAFDAPLKLVTVTVGGTASDGVYSFDVDDITVGFTADTGGGDDNTAISVGLEAQAKDNDLEVLEVVKVSRSALVITLVGRQTGDSFSVSNAVAPGTGTLTIAVVEDGLEGDLELGIGVVLDPNDAGSIVRPSPGDLKMFGVVAEGPGLKQSSGNPDDNDVYVPGTAVPLVRQGPVPVIVEVDITAGDAAFCRATFAGAEVGGHFRNDADGGDAFQVPGEFISDSWTDSFTGHKVAVLDLNLPG